MNTYESDFLSGELSAEGGSCKWLLFLWWWWWLEPNRRSLSPVFMLVSDADLLILRLWRPHFFLGGLALDGAILARWWPWICNCWCVKRLFMSVLLAADAESLFNCVMAFWLEAPLLLDGELGLGGSLWALCVVVWAGESLCDTHGSTEYKTPPTLDLPDPWNPNTRKTKHAVHTEQNCKPTKNTSMWYEWESLAFFLHFQISMTGKDWSSLSSQQ